MNNADSLQDILGQYLPLAYGVSGPLTSPLMRKEQVINLLRTAHLHGVQIYDTSPSYGGGLGEHYLAEAFGGAKDIFITTKAGLVSHKLSRPSRDFSCQHIETSIFASLRRLKRTKIDLVWLHGPNPSEMTDDFLRLLERLKASGDVGYFGIAGRNKAAMAVARGAMFDAVMLPLNLNSPPANARWAQDMRNLGKCVFAIEVLAGQKLGLSTRGGIWRAAKWATGRGGNLKNTAPDIPLAEALIWPKISGLADCIVSTTTKAAHIIENAAQLQRLRIN